MEQMAVESTLRADVKDKGRVMVREERTQDEDEESFPGETEGAEASIGEDVKQPRASNSSSSSLLSVKMHLRRSSSVASCTTDDSSFSQHNNKGGNVINMQNNDATKRMEDLTNCSSPCLDCADIILNCLFCRFYNMIIMLPNSCERLTHHCCPNYKQVFATATEVESTSSDDDDACTAMDCGVFNSCHDASDCLELAMEVSEICYH